MLENIALTFCEDAAGVLGRREFAVDIIPTGWYHLMMTSSSTAIAAKAPLLASALKLVRENDHDATMADGLDREAGVEKDAYYHKFDDPLDQLIGYVDFRIQLLEGRSLAECTCLLGTMVQEKFESSPAIRDACFAGIHIHATEVAKLIVAAKSRHAPQASWGAESLALYTQSVIQGAFVLAKAKNDVALAADMIRHLRRYIELLFHHAKED